MKTLKVFLCLVALQFVSLVVFESCCDDTPRQFTLTGFSLYNSGFIEERGRIVNQLDENVNRMPALDYALYGVFDSEFIAEVYNPKNWTPFISTAAANYCRRDRITDLEMKSIHIKSLNNFDNEHLEGDNVSNYFHSRDTFNNHDTLTNINEFVAYYNEQLKVGYLEYDFHLLLNQTPTLDSIFRFEVVVEWENGDRLVDTTEQIILY